MKNIEIIPAILPKDYAEMVDKAELIKGLAKIVQIDICDGHFVPNFTWPYKKKDNNFEAMLREEIGLPAWEDLEYEFDLMVNNPGEIVEDWVTVGASRIVLHAESKGDLNGAINTLQGKVEVGLALNIDTDINILDTYFDNENNRQLQTSDAGNLLGGQISFIQLMGIDRIGFQGQDFDSKVLDKIKLVKKKYPNIAISIDGGVSLDTTPELVKAGATRLVVGSALFNSENIFETWERFQNL